MTSELGEVCVVLMPVNVWSVEMRRILSSRIALENFLLHIESVRSKRGRGLSELDKQILEMSEHTLDDAAMSGSITPVLIDSSAGTLAFAHEKESTVFAAAVFLRRMV